MCYSTLVTRVLKSSSSKDNPPTILTVEFADEDARAPLFTLTASKEVILSAGSIGTPHILLSSGIGDAGELTTIVITPLVDLPDMGKKFSDQLAAGGRINNNATLEAELFEKWKKDKTGPLVAIQTTHLAWSRIPADSKIFEDVPDPASGPNSPHYELVFGGSLGFSTPSGHFFRSGAAVVSPTSRGSVALNSTNPFDPPLIDPNYLAIEFDIFVLRESMQSIFCFLAAPAWKDYIIGPPGPLAGATTDELLDEYNRQISVSSILIYG